MNNFASHRIGIDIGRVLLGPTREDGGADTSFLSGSDERALSSPPAPGAFEAAARLAERTGGNVWLVSKCGPRIQDLTARWLERQGFWACTGLDREHLRFCLRRPEKRVHAEELRLTHFVDDRLEVLEALRGLVPSLVLFGHQRAPAPEWVTPALDWPSALVALGFVEDGEELRRNLTDQPDAVGRERERVAGARHRA